MRRTLSANEGDTTNYLFGRVDGGKPIQCLQDRPTVDNLKAISDIVLSFKAITYYEDKPIPPICHNVLQGIDTWARPLKIH
jgi:hypothetical protein